VKREEIKSDMTKFETRQNQQITDMWFESGGGKKFVAIKVADMTMDHDYDFADHSRPISNSEGCICICAKACARDPKKQSQQDAKDKENAKAASSSSHGGGAAGGLGSILGGLGRKKRDITEYNPLHLRDKRQTIIHHQTRTHAKHVKKIKVKYTVTIETQGDVNVYVFAPERNVRQCPESMCKCDCMCEPKPDDPLQHANSHQHHAGGAGGVAGGATSSSSSSSRSSSSRTGGRGRGRGQGRGQGGS